MAVVYSRRSDCGSARVVSSVTYIVVMPSLTAKAIASSVVRCRYSIVQPSAYCRMGLDPMKAQHSMGTPVRCWISAMGLMSAAIVRAAQFARIFKP